LKSVFAKSLLELIQGITGMHIQVEFISTQLTQKYISVVLSSSAAACPFSLLMSSAEV
jgi:hypothetical protein